jgi:flagellar hook-basal body complex protein FliE
MNALAAIRQLITPELRPVPLPKNAAPAAEAPPIPLSELKDLPPAFVPQSPLAPVEVPGSFSSVLGQFVGEVNAKQNAAGIALNGLLSGQNVSLHQAMIAMEEANVSFQLMVEVRNKLLDSYQELMRMQV